MSLPQKYLKLVSELVTQGAIGGAIGVALLLGSAASSAASQDPVGQQPTRAQDERVSERLAAIREAVSAVSGPEAQTEERAGGRRMAWHNGWGNGLSFGFGHPWGNFNFGTPWNNWNNWRNGWNNWRNGWGNW
ncbi:MAG TPA: GrrA/OscA1 family cyclophane-containing rSAM-modified RiPP [Stellaceae bacterium]|nr:GrrA/OscA1 family cyclophane-containing rSAM-modified RiPP [Stellaceae bacterium]